jgi:hypothetical protein
MMGTDEEAVSERGTPDDGISFGSDIIYRYLTFDTPLPSSIARILSPGQHGKELVPPDLSSLTDPFAWRRRRSMCILCPKYTKCT